MQAASAAAAEIEKPTETTQDCRFCWMCRQACPVGHVTARETLTPHGWALTIDATNRGTITWTPETVDVLYACADCGLCRAHCITDRPLPDAIALARAELVRQGKAPTAVQEINERLKRELQQEQGPEPSPSPAATVPEVARALEARRIVEQGEFPAQGAASGAPRSSAPTGVASAQGAGFGAPRSSAPTGAASAQGAGFGAPNVVAAGAASADAAFSAKTGRAADVGAAGDLVAAGPDVGRVGTSAVGLFVGNFGSVQGGAELAAVRRLLSGAGVSVLSLGSGRSNGVVASSLGLTDTAASLARRVVADVVASGCRELLVLTPEDRFGFERLYRDRLGVLLPEGVVVREVSEVLAQAFDAGRLRFRQRADVVPYVYHDPCHAARVSRDDLAPRRLLAAALGSAAARDMFWRGRRAHPCGATGGLELTQPAIAGKLADARLADARAAGAGWLITDDPACAQHLRGRSSSDITVLGFYALLAEQLVS